MNDRRTCVRTPIGRLRNLILAGLGALLFLFAPLAWAQSEAALAVSVDGPHTAMGGDPYTYTVTVLNNGPDGVTNALFDNVFPVDTSYSSTVTVTCQNAIGGAVCPTPASFSVVGGTHAAVTIPSLPANSRLDIVISGSAFQNETKTVTNTATITSPAGVTNPNPDAATSWISTTITASTPHIPVADMSVTKTADVTTFPGSGNAITYTVTYANAGPESADGAIINDSFRIGSNLGSGTRAYTTQWVITGCTATPGATCPDFPTGSGTASTTMNGPDEQVWNNVAIPALPAGSSITITYTVTMTETTGTCSPANDFGLSNTATISGGSRITDPDNSNNSAQATVTSIPNPSYCNDVRLNKTQNPTAFPGFGNPITYTVTYTNNSPYDASGTSISDTASLDGSPVNMYDASWQILGCTEAGGAQCPDFTPDSGSVPSFNYGNRALAWPATTVIPVFPVGGSITITYTLTLEPDPAGVCVPPRTYSLSNQAAITSQNSGVQYTATVMMNIPTPTCPQASLSVTKTADPAIFPGLGQPVSYSVTYANAGPDSADGTVIADQIGIANSGSGNAFDQVIWTGVTCTTSGGAICPTLASSGSTAANVSSTAWNNASIDTFPKDSSVTITYTAMVTANPSSTHCGGAQASLRNTATLTPPPTVAQTGAISSAVSDLPITCADIAVHKAESVTTASPTAPETYVITLTNDGPQTAENVVFTDPLPSGFTYTSASCQAADSGGVCGPLSYDTASRTVSGVMPSINNGSSVAITIVGAAANTATGTVANQACATLQDSRHVDPNALSNCSSVSFEIYGTTSPVTVTKTVAGAPAGGLPQAMTFTGTVSCGIQGAQTWSVTVPAGGTSASAEPLNFTDGDTCTVTEDPPPAAPAGTVWSGAPVFNPASASFTMLLPSTPVAVGVTNTLGAAPSPVISITKTADPPGALSPNGQVTYTVIVTNTGTADASNVTFHDPLPAGIASATWSCAPTGAGAACPAASGSSTGMDAVASQLIPGLPVDAKLTYTITATATGTAAALPATVVNTATATGSSLTCANGAALPCAATVTNPATPVIAISKTANPTAALTPGMQVIYTVIVANTSTVAASNVTFSDPLPTGIASATWACAPTGAGAACPAASGSSTGTDAVAGQLIPALPAGAKLTYTITATAQTAALLPPQVINTAMVTGDGFICNGGAAPPCEASVTNPAPLALDPPFAAKSVSVVDSQTLRWTITVDNSANATAQAIELRDPLPAGMSVVSGTVACQPFGATTVSQCDYDAANDQIVVAASLAPDTGAAANPAAGPNRLVVTFDATYTTATPVAVTNTAQECWSPDNDPATVTVCANLVSAQASYDPNSGRINGGGTRPIPLGAALPWLLLLLLPAAARRGLIAAKMRR